MDLSSKLSDISRKDAVQKRGRVVDAVFDIEDPLRKAVSFLNILDKRLHSRETISSEEQDDLARLSAAARAGLKQATAKYDKLFRLTARGH